MAVILSRSLQNYTDVATQAGLDPAAQLRAAGIEPALLDAPEARLPARAVCELLENSARDAGLDDFGLRMLAGRTPSALGPLALLFHVEPTVRHAIAAMVRYQMLHDEAVHLHLAEADGVAAIRITYSLDGCGAFRQLADLAVGAVHHYLAGLLGGGWRARRVCFAHGRPASAASHARLFGPGAEFNSEMDGVVCRSSDLDTPIAGGGAAASERVHVYLATLAAPAQRSLAWKVRQLVELRLAGGSCTAEAVARDLGMPLRTFYFQMQGEGASFAAILDATRRERALRYLARADCRLGDVSDLLGFSALSAFSRWFRQRFGCCASAWVAQRK